MSLFPQKSSTIVSQNEERYLSSSWEVWRANKRGFNSYLKGFKWDYLPAGKRLGTSSLHRVPGFSCIKEEGVRGEAPDQIPCSTWL